VQYVVCDQSRHLALSIWRYRFGGASTERGIGVEHLPMTIKTEHSDHSALLVFGDHHGGFDVECGRAPRS